MPEYDNPEYATQEAKQLDPRRTTRSSFAEAQKAINERQSRAYAGEAAQTRSASTLEEIAERIHMACTRLDGITDLMMDHADRVHGPTPVGNGAGDCEETPHSQMSRIFQALERLDGAVNRNAYEAGRNTNIA